MLDSKTQKLVDASMYFIRAVTEVYGPERAMLFWDRLADTINPDLKGLVLVAMLGLDSGGFRIIDLPRTHPNEIAIIKAIRTWDKRGLGLIEARKLLNDFSKIGYIELQVYHEKVSDASKDFERLGCVCRT